jgi:hypothetical protein
MLIKNGYIIRTCSLASKLFQILTPNDNDLRSGFLVVTPCCMLGGYQPHGG